MKKSLRNTIGIAVLVVALFLIGTVQTASASGIVSTANNIAVTRLYDQNGNLIKNHSLAANTNWVVGKTITIDGNTMYQVSTNEYVNASDVIFR